MLKAMDRWLLPWLGQKLRSPRSLKDTHLFIAVCDHFEPFHDAGKETAIARVRRWSDDYGPKTASFRDASGRTPRHTFFHPVEQYDADVLEMLRSLCSATGSEVEVHLHHDRDTEETLRVKLREGIATLVRHGHLSTDAAGATRFAFIHGNWALANCHPEGRNCGVANEIKVLREEGCFADLTFPSAPSPTQPRAVNQVCYVREGGSPAVLDRGERAAVQKTAARRDESGSLLMVHGPLGLNWGWRKFGVLPRVENADLTGFNPPTANRLALWRRVAPSVQGMPSWQFVKLHTHGAVPRTTDMFLGAAMQRFHETLAAAAVKYGFHPHYVTAREMVNLIHAAEDGASGDPTPWFDYLFRKRAAQSS